MKTFNWQSNDKFASDLLAAQSNLLDDAVSWITANLDPDEVFDVKKLEAWAYENGFKKFE